MSKEKEITLAEKFAKFKEHGGSAPVVYKSLSVRVNDNEKEVALSVQEVDRDGETVLMDGMRLPDHIKENGIPMIDSHNSRDSVVTNGLGAFRNPRIGMVNGKQALIVDPDFAPTPNGLNAKILYLGVDGGKPYFTNVSMGFAVYDYDNNTGEIKEWEPFEGSLVTVGANMSARFVDKSIADDTTIAKNLARFQQIKDPFKEFTKLFLDDAFCVAIGYEKDGDLLVDINGVYDTLNKHVQQAQEAPEPQEAPTVRKVSNKAAKAQIDSFFQTLEDKLKEIT